MSIQSRPGTWLDWWLGVSLIIALVMETSFAALYMGYAFVFIWAYE